jgi:uridine kinase
VTGDDGGDGRLDTAILARPGRWQDMDQGTRDELLGRLAEAVGSVTVAHPKRVAIDGPPAAGKTTLADELAVVLRAEGRHVIRATIDDFLFPRAQRYPRGEYSAEGCYFDTHDYHALNRVLLDPLGPGGDRRFRPAVYDRTADTVLVPPVTTAPADAVLVFDGVFLMRPELIDRWDVRVFVSTTLRRTVERAVIRERRVSPRADVERRWRERYIPSQQLYFATVRPTDHVDIIVHNDEPQRPAWETPRRPRSRGTHGGG